MEISLVNYLLPKEILAYAFTFLPLSDQKTVALVSKHWNQAANDEKLWNQLINRDWTVRSLKKVCENLRLNPITHPKEVYHHILAHIRDPESYLNTDEISYVDTDTETISAVEKNPQEAMKIIVATHLGLEKTVKALALRVSPELLQGLSLQAQDQRDILMLELFSSSANSSVHRADVLTVAFEAGDFARTESLLPNTESEAKQLILDLVGKRSFSCLDYLVEKRVQLLKGTYVHEAIWKKEDRALANLIVTKNIDPNRKDDYGFTPLHWAAILKREGVMQTLLSCKKLEHNSQDAFGNTPFIYAYFSMTSGVGETIFNILLKEEHVNHNPLFYSSKGWIPLLYDAIYEDRASIVMQILSDERVNPNTIHAELGAPLHYAVTISVNVVRALLSCSRTDPNIDHPLIGTPLHLAVQYKSEEEIVRELLDHLGVDPFARRGNVDTAFEIAVQNKDSEIVALFKEHPRTREAYLAAERS
jgi:ankyrin repeat protein